MPESSSDVLDAGEVTQSVANNPWVRAFFSWISVVVLAVALSSFLAKKLLPHSMGTAVSSILLDAMSVTFILAFPAFEVILWKLFPELPKKGFLGYLFLLLGFEIGLPIATIIAFVTAFLPALSPPMPLTMIVAALVGVAFVLSLLGLAIVVVDVIREIVRLFRERGQLG